MTDISSHNSKLTLIGSMQDQKIARSVLLYALWMVFSASLLNNDNVKEQYKIDKANSGEKNPFN